MEIHEHRADTLLVPALIFLVLLAATVLVGRRAQVGTRVDGPGAAHAATVANPATLQRITLVTGILAALAGLVVTGLVVWIGHAGSAAAYSGVGADCRPRSGSDVVMGVRYHHLDRPVERLLRLEVQGGRVAPRRDVGQQ